MVKIICDGGSCHMGKWEYIKELCDVAKTANVWAIKFQLFEGNANNNIEFPRKYWQKTVDYCKEIGLDIFASVWDNEAVDLLWNSGIKKVKLAYSQAFNLRLLKYIKKYDFKIIASGDEQNFPYYADIKLFCVPKYPLTKIPYFYGLSRNNWDGFSSHALMYNLDFKVIYRQPFTQEKDMEYLEKHITLDYHDINCPDHWFALSPKELKELSCALLQ